MKYIFEIHVRPGQSVEEYVEAWKSGSAIIQKQPGAQGTRLFRKIGEPDVLLAIADWTSKQHRDDAMAALALADPETQDVLRRHEMFGKLRMIGEFTDTTWKS